MSRKAGRGILLLGWWLIAASARVWASDWAAVVPLTNAAGLGCAAAARQLLASRPEAWLMVTTGPLRFIGRDSARLERAADMGDFFNRSATFLPDAARADAVATILLLEDEVQWRELAASADWRGDSRALQDGNELFFLWETNAAANAYRLYHELAHWRFWTGYLARPPLWLDEGLAAHWGWDLAQAYGRQSGGRPQRARAPAALRSLIRLDDLTAMKRLPVEPAAVTAFYRQAEELAAAIERRLGRARMGEFVARMTNGRKGWKKTLAEMADISARECRTIEMEVNSFSLQQRED